MGFLGIVHGLAHCIYFPLMVFLLDILLQKKKADADEHQLFSVFNQFYAGITARSLCHKKSLLLSQTFSRRSLMKIRFLAPFGADQL